jgi:hypothetical protein
VKPAVRLGAAAALVVLAVLGTGTVRELVVGARAVEDCDAALERNDPRAAIVAAREAAEALVPGSPYPERGYRRLETIAHDAEMRGDDPISGAAWRAMRSAALGTQAINASNRSRLEMANQGIARVGSQERVPESPNLPSDVRPSEDVLLAALRADAPPSPAVFVLLAAGAVAFFAGALRLTWMASDPRGSLTLRAARVPLACAVAGAVAYLLACMR